MATSRSTRPPVPAADPIAPSPGTGAKSKRKDAVSKGSRPGEARTGNGPRTAGRNDAPKDETPVPEQATSGAGRAPEPRGERLSDEERQRRIAEAAYRKAEERAPEPRGERLSDEERQRRIAEAAYRKAEERGFRGDRQLDDWLEAEREHNNGAKRAG